MDIQPNYPPGHIPAMTAVCLNCGALEPVSRIKLLIDWPVNNFGYREIAAHRVCIACHEKLTERH
jgi:hypothetical protein